MAEQNRMTQQLHVNATTTPEMRAFIRASDMSVAALSRLLNISEATVRKWKTRDSLDDVSHRSHTLQTTLTPAQEYVAVELRRSLQLSLDSLLVVVKRFINPNASRSGLARCLKRHGVSRLSDLKLQEVQVALEGAALVNRIAVEDLNTREVLEPEVTQFALAQYLGLAAKEGASECGVVNVTSVPIPEVANQEAAKNLFVAADPSSGWVYVDLYEDDTMAAANRYMKHVFSEAPFHIRKILAGNYADFKRKYRAVESE